MTTVGADNLPRPHFVNVDDDSGMLVTPGTNQPRFRVIDDQVLPRRFSASWAQARAEIALAVQRHHDQHPHTVVPLVVTATAEVVRAQWSGPPQVQWTSPGAANIQAQFDEVLAFE